MKKNILVITKGKKINSNLKDILKINGHRSEFCSDILEGINRLKTNNFNVVIMEVDHSVEDINLINKMRKDNELSKLEKRIKLLEQKNSSLRKKLLENAGSLNKLSNDLQDAYMQTIKALAQAIDARDHYTHSHSENVTRYAVSIAQQLGLNQEAVEQIREACELHDLGKIAICDDILSKTEPLNTEEWKQIKAHSSKAAEILKPLSYLSEVIEIIRQHHERFDGGGYPEGKKGADIVLGARIIAVADAYDAMTSARSYRKNPLAKDDAIEELRRNRMTQFDPQIADIFLKIIVEKL